MNFSRIPAHTLLGKLLRLPLRLIPPQATLPILQGRAAGKKWIVGSGDHGYWLGSYEYEKQRLFERMVTPGSVVFDVGAHTGYYTLLASVLVGPQGRVFAFEPLPANVAYLQRHLQLNSITNVTVVEAAVSDRRGLMSFDPGPNSSMGHFSPQGSLRVQTVSLDDLVAAGAAPAPGHIKIDVESAEMLVLCGARNLLASAHPTLYLATDTGDLHHQCCVFLSSIGYQLQPVGVSDLDHAYEILAYYPPNADGRDRHHSHAQ